MVNLLASYWFAWDLIFQAEKVIAELNKTFPVDDLLPIYISPDRGIGSYSTITFGAMGDRYWSLKTWILIPFIDDWASDFVIQVTLPK
jgi:hypothetical protein